MKVSQLERKFPISSKLIILRASTRECGAITNEVLFFSYKAQPRAVGIVCCFGGVWQLPDQ